VGVESGPRRGGCPAAVTTTLAEAAATLALAMTTTAATCAGPVTTSPVMPLDVRVFTMPARPVCDDAQGPAVDVAAIAPPALREVSGVAASPQNPRALWLVADSGNPAVVTAVSVDDGQPLLEVALPVDNVDWEDVAVGPCPDLGGPCVFVADTGHKDGDRAGVVVYAFPEPRLDDPALPVAGRTADGAPRVDLDVVWAMPMTLPAGDTDDDGRAVDLEAIAVLPDATALLLFEKTKAASARVYAYRAPWTPLLARQSPAAIDAVGRPLERTGIVTLPVDVFGAATRPKDRRITGASLHWSGTRLLLRTTGGVVEFAVDDPAALFDPSGLVPVRVWPSPPDEEQGEAVAWDADGTGVWTIAEARRDARQALPVLHRSVCGGGAP
jgi:hypothetical protein